MLFLLLSALPSRPSTCKAHREGGSEGGEACEGARREEGRGGKCKVWEGANLGGPRGELARRGGRGVERREGGALKARGSWGTRGEGGRKKRIVFGHVPISILS